MTVVINKSTAIDGNRGAWVERGIATIIPSIQGTITANLGLECSFDDAISANIGDQIFVNGWNLTAGIIPSGARITAQGVGKVKLYNVTGSNLASLTAQTFDYTIIHYNS